MGLLRHPKWIKYSYAIGSTLRQKELFKQAKKQATKNHLTYLHHSLQLIDVNRLVLEL